MPVMVVGADTERGRPIAERFLGRDREVRVFVTDAGMAEEFRAGGAKVALGDVSDDSHVSGACLNCFSVVLVADAATDERQRSFAATPQKVMEGWARAAADAGIRRVIWVVEGDPPPTTIGEVAVVDPYSPGLVDAVFDLDAARRI